MIIMTEEPAAHDEASPGVGDHPFDPSGEWWSLCKHCGLARAAHRSSTIDVRRAMFEEQMARYGEIRHHDPVRKAELEREFRQEPKVHPGGRLQIGHYVGDDDE